MREHQFTPWLKHDYATHRGTPLQTRPIGDAISRCRRVEKYLGNLDDHYRRDGLMSLLDMLTLPRGNFAPRHNIPIEGNCHTGTASLKNAVRLYLEFCRSFSPKSGQEVKTAENQGPGHPHCPRIDMHQGHRPSRIVRRNPPAAVTLPSGVSASLQLENLQPLELLQTYAAILAELSRRGIARSINSPVADYTEWLVAKTLDLELVGNSGAGYDAVGADGKRYQIKGRRAGAESSSFQLSALRNLHQKNFDILVGVVFDGDFSVRHAMVVPQEVVVEQSRYNEHTHSHIFHIRPRLLDDPRVQDIRQRLQDCMS